MRITKIRIAPDDRGTGNLEIEARPDGAMVSRTTDGPGVGLIERLGLMQESDTDEAKWMLAETAAGVIYGTDRKGRALATNSMIHDLLREIERVV